MQKTSKVACFLVFLMFFGCASWVPKGKGPVFQLDPPKDGMSTVYHYRIRKSCGNAAAYTLVSNDEVVTIIGNGGYYTQHIEPGIYVYKTIRKLHGGPIFYGPILIGNLIDNAFAKAEPAYTLEAKSNETYFLRLNACFADKRIEEVPEEVAMKELVGLKAFESASEK